MSGMTIQHGLLALTLAVSVYTDIRYGKVFNVIVLPGMLFGLVSGMVVGGWPDLWASCLGLLVGGGLLFLPFLFGIMGGGDVKLAAAIGSLGGMLFVLETVAYAFVLGAGVALAIRFFQGRLGDLFKECWHILFGFILNLPGPIHKTNHLGPAHSGVPFAVCLAGGALGAKWLGFFNLLVAR
ncbi:MAG: prepilin peptidase [Deltaproteobacteria bacterium]|nr:prepilin peptidase [Deltaproteobacteria bacterium]